MNNLFLNEFFVLISMIIMYIIADFIMQTESMRNMKQKRWWDKILSEYNYDKKLYKSDYLVMLFEHSFLWSFLILLPLILYRYNTILLLILIIVNTLVHAYIDNLKANKLKINLLEDQLFHLIQISITYAFYILLPLF